MDVADFEDSPIIVVTKPEVSAPAPIYGEKVSAPSPHYGDKVSAPAPIYGDKVSAPIYGEKLDLAPIHAVRSPAPFRNRFESAPFPRKATIIPHPPVLGHDDSPGFLPDRTFTAPSSRLERRNPPFQHTIPTAPPPPMKHGIGDDMMLRQPASPNGMHYLGYVSPDFPREVHENARTKAGYNETEEAKEVPRNRVAVASSVLSGVTAESDRSSGTFYDRSVIRKMRGAMEDCGKLQEFNKYIKEVENMYRTNRRTRHTLLQFLKDIKKDLDRPVTSAMQHVWSRDDYEVGLAAYKRECLVRDVLKEELNEKSTLYKKGESPLRRIFIEREKWLTRLHEDTDLMIRDDAMKKHFLVHHREMKSVLSNLVTDMSGDITRLQSVIDRMYTGHA